MRIAVISDIHANLPALEAVMEDVDKQQVDDIFCLGDLVNFAGWDREVIELIKKRNITSLQGNHDEGIGYNKSMFSFSHKTKEQHEFGLLSMKRVQETLTKEYKTFLSNLPFMLQLQFRFPFHNLYIAMVHGSPSNNTEYIYSNSKDEYLLELMDSINCDILLMGHTHKPFHRAIFCEEENRKIYRHAINAGSVGKPKHGNNNACYVILEMSPEHNLSDPSSVRVHFMEVPYDVEKVIRHIHEIGLPDAYDDFLKHGEV